MEGAEKSSPPPAAIAAKTPQKEIITGEASPQTDEARIFCVVHK